LPASKQTCPRQYAQLAGFAFVANGCERADREDEQNDLENENQFAFRNGALACSDKNFCHSNVLATNFTTRLRLSR
jgi:hypothetical protein